ncbi:MAG: PepSY-like domain-containing protein [Muribaculaceae bacterium]|nr:PepSY-like domain-containing protein [Muribaculaceae bacterium]MDE6551475.1 PepSY-like domain-containing protein [Muribaculaceae bacterium]
MKKFMLILAVLFGVMTASARDNYSHDVEILPAAAKIMLKENFKSDVSHIKIGKEFGQIRKYEVILTDGTEVSFDKHGNWKDVEVGRNSSVPAAFMLSPIATFIKENQGKAKVTGIEKKSYGYEVELSNGVDVRFSEKGKFLRYDN